MPLDQTNPPEAPRAQANAAEVRRGISALFRNAAPGGFIVWRIFPDEGGAVEHGTFPHDAATSPERIVELARRTGADERRLTLALPLAIFRERANAKEANVAQGLTLTVDVDTGEPAAALADLKEVLGRPTLIVASGSDSTFENGNGGMQPRIHLHWRLASPACTEQEQAELREARRLAAKIANADRSMAPISHPIRLPGFVNRKNEREAVARILKGGDEAAEIDLATALAALRAATAGPSAPPQPVPAAPMADPGLLAPGGIGDVAALLSDLPNDDAPYPEWRRVIVAAKEAAGGDAAILPAVLAWSAKAPRYQGAQHRSATVAEFNKPAPDDGRPLAGWRTLMGLMRAAVPGWVPPSERSASPATGPAAREEWPEPLDILADDERAGLPTLTPAHLPPAFVPYVFDVAGRLGVDPSSLGLACLVAAAGVSSDHWKLQPRQHDTGWTEAPRIWGAIVADPSAKKTPTIRAALAPVEAMGVEAARRHAQEMAAWKAKIAENRAAQRKDAKG